MKYSNIGQGHYEWDEKNAGESKCPASSRSRSVSFYFLFRLQCAIQIRRHTITHALHITKCIKFRSYFSLLNFRSVCWTLFIELLFVFPIVNQGKVWQIRNLRMIYNWKNKCFFWIYENRSLHIILYIFDTLNI